VSPRRLVRDTLGFAIAQYVVRGAFMLRGIIAARLLGPSAYGAWNALMLVIEYGASSQMGTQQGLDRLMPQRVVEGDRARAHRLERAGMFNVAVLALVYGACVMAYFARQPGEVRGFWGMTGIALAILCVLLSNLAGAHLTLLRAHGDMRSVTGWFVLQAGVSVALGLGLIPWLGAWALLWGWLAGHLVGLVYARSRVPDRAPGAPAWAPESLELLRVGFAMFLYLWANLVLRTVDRLVVLRFEGAEALGLYTLGVMALTLVMNSTDSVCYVLYPKLLRVFTAEGHRPEAIRARVLRTLTVFAVSVPAVCSVIFIGAREAVMLVLPSFVEGAGALRVLCFGALGLAVANLSSLVLMIMHRRVQLMAVALVPAAAGGALSVWALKAGFGIQGVAWCMFATYVATGALMLWLAARALGLGAAGAAGVLARAHAPLGLGFALAVGLDRLMPAVAAPGAWAGPARVVLNAAVFLPLYVLAVRPLVRGLGMRRLLAEAGVPGFGPAPGGGEP